MSIGSELLIPDWLLPWGWTLIRLLGLGTDTDFSQTVYAPWSVHFVNLQLLAGAASMRLGTLNDLASATVSIRITILQERTENIDFPLCQVVL